MVENALPREWWMDKVWRKDGSSPPALRFGSSELARGARHYVRKKKRTKTRPDGLYSAEANRKSVTCPIEKRCLPPSDLADDVVGPSDRSVQLATPRH